jgi:G3E family GTPase
VTIVTGFLGSGKTTLMNRLLREGPRSAVLINEFGSTPIDHRLMERQDLPLTVLSGGCLCCQVRGALAPTLKNLWLAWHQNGGRPFDRLLIGTGDVASPEPVLDTMLRERWLAPRLHVQGIISTLSANAGLAQLEAYPEVRAQLAWADRIVVTHTDLTDTPRLAELEAHLNTLYPGIPRMCAVRGEPVSGSSQETARSAPRSDSRSGDPDYPDHSFRSISLILDHPVELTRLCCALERLVARHSRRLLRIKGIVRIPGCEHSVAIQAAGGRLYPPANLQTRPTDDGRGRLVLITDGDGSSIAEELLGLIHGSAAIGDTATIQAAPGS